MEAAFFVEDDLRLEYGRAVITLPYPNAGYGGHELVRSPDGRHLAVFLYSGQSEQGWELFQLEPVLVDASLT
jgi:hypothetical protein